MFGGTDLRFRGKGDHQVMLVMFPIVLHIQTSKATHDATDRGSQLAPGQTVFQHRLASMLICKKSGIEIPFRVSTILPTDGKTKGAYESCSCVALAMGPDFVGLQKKFCDGYIVPAFCANV